jgi:hypothetical protein
MTIIGRHTSLSTRLVAQREPGADVALTLRRRHIRLLMLAAIATLLLLSLAGQIAKHLFGLPNVGGLVSLFHVDDENNLPSWYQSVAYLCAAVLLALIALPRLRRGAAFARHWGALAAIFLFLSLDEMGSLHERSTEPLQRLIDLPAGVWMSGWVILGLLGVAALGLVYLRFFFIHLGRPERVQVALAATLLVGGALGMETANAALDLGDVEERKQTLLYVVMVHVEEALEMLGLAVFIDFLLGKLARGPRIAIAAAD